MVWIFLFVCKSRTSMTASSPEVTKPVALHPHPYGPIDARHPQMKQFARAGASAPSPSLRLRSPSQHQRENGYKLLHVIPFLYSKFPAGG
jgi:hypothetical protein